MSARRCAYCGKEADVETGDSACACRYRAGRMGDFSVSAWNTTREGTVAEMRKEFEDMTKSWPGGENVVWMFSVTKLDDAKIAKADAKRDAANGEKR